MKAADDKIKAWFLGPKAENADLMEKLIVDVFRDHVFWRRNFHPEDRRHISESDKRRPHYEESMTQLQQALGDLLARLKNDIPFFSPRYIGHMLSDQVLPGTIGYFAAMLYNPNNVTRESSPVTTTYELEVAQQLARMIGYSEQNSWGHVTSGGTVANFEALWVARNLKYFPLAVKDCLKAAREENFLGRGDKVEVTFPDGTRAEDISQRDDWELVNLNPEEALRVGERLQGLLAEKAKESGKTWCRGGLAPFLISEQGMQRFFQHHAGLKPGVVLVPQNRHYSLDKVVGALGLGRGAMLRVSINKKFRMDLGDLHQKLTHLAQERIPVIAVVSVCGSTEEGALDELDKIVEMRRELAECKNFTFYLHSDAAYGGYFASLLYEGGIRRSESEFLSRTSLSAEVYRSLAALQQTDSVTVDPHKLGFVPYPAGGIVFKNRTLRELTAFRAPYIFHEGSGDDFIGGYILEGSKPGAAAAACYLAHKLIPLDASGYGALLERITECASQIYEFIKGFTLAGYRIQPLSAPDTNIVCFILNQEGNRSLKKMNDVNRAIYRRFSFQEKPGFPISAHDFFLSMTEFTFELYHSKGIGDLLESLGIEPGSFASPDRDHPERSDRIVVLRMTAMNPFLRESNYVKQFAEGLRELLEGCEDSPATALNELSRRVS